ncbi:ribosomal protein S18 acetylase RimI-like enzyme [Streptomyces sp. TE33382]
MIATYSCCEGGRLSTGRIASTGQASAQAPQSIQVFGSMCSISVLPNARSSGVGWMQLTGHTDTQVASLQQVWVMA